MMSPKSGVYAFWMLFTFCYFMTEVEAGFKDHRQPYRTGYHFQPLKNWMNDPNGPLLYNGVYHIFYQHNPQGPLFGNISWGHAISHDLINWVHVDIALAPSQAYDINGCFSGSATILPTGEPVILYTGFDASSHQVQNLAVPKNKSDPMLNEWVKWSLNPIMTPPDRVDPGSFRDPSTGWMGADGEWRVAVGAMVDNQGSAILYKSKDFKSWTMSPNPLLFTNKTDMLECPDFYPVLLNGTTGLDPSVQGKNITHVFKASFNHRDYYVLGTYDPNSDQYDVGVELMDSRSLRYDYGRFYASKSFYDDWRKRRVLWSWVSEGDSKSDAVTKGWSGLQTIPRSIWLSEKGDQLVQLPVKELKKLRAGMVQLRNKKLNAGSTMEISGITASQADVEIAFSVSNLRDAEVLGAEVVDPQTLCRQKNASVSGNFGPFGLLVLASKDLTEYTAVFFRVFRTAKSFRVLMCVDPSRSSLRPNVDNYIYGAFVALDPRYKKISLKTLIDHSIVESFGANGLACITARVYPKLAVGKEAHLYAFNNGTISLSISRLSAWSMKNARLVSTKKRRT